MSTMSYKSVVCLLTAFLLGACGTIDKRVDPDEIDEVGGANLRSQDIRTMADEMTRSIIASGILKNATPENRVSFYMTSLRNDSGDVMDTELILTKIRTGLFKGLGRQVMILDRSKQADAEIRKERAAKRAGAVKANPDMRGNLAGSDFVLKGTIKDRVLQSGSLKSAYYLVTFELTDLETGELCWTGDYESKFVSEKSVISR